MSKKVLEKGIPYSMRRNRFLNFFPRIMYATRYYNPKYTQILKWGFSSREDTNFTYDLTPINRKYLASTVAFVTKRPYETILKYIEEIRNDTELKSHVINKIMNSQFRDVADNRCEFGRRLGWYAFARAIKPKVIIETGVDKGHGAVLLCSALLRNRQEGHEGRYYGTDIDPAAGYLLDGRYKQVGKVLYGDSIESLKRFDKKIDLFINDSDHSDEYEYGEYLTVKDKLSPRAIILGDNSHGTDKLFLFSIRNNRNFLFFQEVPQGHWYPGAGIGISFISDTSSPKSE